MSNQSALASAPIALVTGATSGIGREIVRDLARTHVVYAVGRDPERLAEFGGFDDENSIVPVRADINDPEAMASLVAELDRLVLEDDVALLGAVRVDPRERLHER